MFRQKSICEVVQFLSDKGVDVDVKNGHRGRTCDSGREWVADRHGYVTPFDGRDSDQTGADTAGGSEALIVGKPVALITGASSGIGEVFARKLAGRGFDLILVARREDRLRALAGELAVQSSVIVADLTTEDGLVAVEQAIRNCAGLELLVNNAGFGTLGRFWEAELRGQEQMHQLHVMAMMRLTHAALRAMVPRDRGGVINVSSVAAFGQTEGNVSYCATKAWANAFTQGLDIELHGRG